MSQLTDQNNQWHAGDPKVSAPFSHGMQTPVSVPCPSRDSIILADGSRKDLQGLTSDQLRILQWEQEQRFAEQIKNSPARSSARAHVIQTAYESVCTILEALRKSGGRKSHGSLSMGMDPRYESLVLSLLVQGEERKVQGGLFELGFGTGLLLKSVASKGYRVGGLEVAESLWEEARGHLPESEKLNLRLGDFMHTDLTDQYGSYSVVYWNDVFEHIPTDEIDDYVQKLYSLLVPGGVLVTITPNWHMRPSDVTSLFKTPRSEAVGFHLKEYTLRQTTSILKRAGFREVRTPVWISSRKMYDSPRLHATAWKLLAEPLLEFLPFAMAVQACRRLGLNCTIATK